MKLTFASGISVDAKVGVRQQVEFCVILFMRRTILLISLIVMAASVTYGLQRDAQWSRFSSTEGRFSVLLPGKPVAEVDNNELGVTRSFTADTDWATYAVGYTDYKNALPNPGQALDGARDALTRSTNSRLLNESRLSINGYPGRELNIVAPGGVARDTTRLYVVGNRLYMVRVVVTPADRDVSGDKERFFSSFRLAVKPARLKRSGNSIAVLPDNGLHPTAKSAAFVARLCRSSVECAAGEVGREVDNFHPNLLG